jgi:hypothetical protein
MKFLFLNFILKSLILGIIFFSINQLLLSKGSFSELQFINITSYTLFLNDVANEASSNDLYSGIKEIFRYGEPGYYHYQNQVQASLDPTLFLSKKSAEYYCRWKNNCGSYPPLVHCFLRSNSSQEIAEIDASLYSNQIRFFISQREELHDCKEEEKATTASLWNDRVATGIVIMGIITAGAWWSSPSCRRSDREQRLSSPRPSSDQDGLLHKKITQKERGESPQDAFFIRSNLFKIPSLQYQENLTPFSYQYFASSDLTWSSDRERGLSGSWHSPNIINNSILSSPRDSYSKESVSFHSSKLSNPQFLAASKNFNRLLRRASKTYSAIDWMCCYEKSIPLLDHHRAILENKADFQKFQESFDKHSTQSITSRELHYQEETKNVAHWEQIVDYCEAIQNLLFSRDKALKENSAKAWDQLAKDCDQAEKLYLNSDLKMGQLFHDCSHEETMRSFNGTDSSTKNLAFLEPPRTTPPVSPAPCPIDDVTSTFTLTLIPYLKLRHEEFLSKRTSSPDVAFSNCDDAPLEEENETLLKKSGKTTMLSNRMKKFMEEYPHYYALYSSIEQQIVDKDNNVHASLHLHPDEEKSVLEDLLFSFEE